MYVVLEHLVTKNRQSLLKKSTFIFKTHSKQELQVLLSMYKKKKTKVVLFFFIKSKGIF